MLVPLSGAAWAPPARNGREGWIGPTLVGSRAARPADTNPNLMLGDGVPTGGSDAPDTATPSANNVRLGAAAQAAAGHAICPGSGLLARPTCIHTRYSDGSRAVSAVAVFAWREVDRRTARSAVPGSAGMPADRWRLNPSGPGGRPGGSPALDRAGGAMRPIGWPRVTASPLQRCTAQECSAARTGASGGLLGHPRRLGGRSGRGGDARARPGSAGRAWGRQEARRERRRAAGKHRGARRMSSTPRACAVCAGGRPVACRRTSVRTRRRSRTARGCCWGRGRGR